MITDQLDFDTSDDLIATLLEDEHVNDSTIFTHHPQSNNPNISTAGLSAGVSGGSTSTSCPYTTYRSSNHGGFNNYGLAMIKTLFAWEHNRIALELKGEYGWANDEYLFQEARARVIALTQKITYSEYIPLFLAYPFTNFVEEYNSSVDATASTLFCTMAHRYAHSTSPDHMPLGGYYDEDGHPHYGGLSILFTPLMSHI